MAAKNSFFCFWHSQQEGGEMSTVRLGNLELTLDESHQGVELTLFRVTSKTTSLGNSILEKVAFFQSPHPISKVREDILCWLRLNGGEGFSKLI